MRLEAPVLCLVTDRRRLVGRDDTFAAARSRLAELALQAVDAGVDIIQVRERDLDAAALVELVTVINDIARGSSTRVVVNDRLDVALACVAGGVHLRSDSIPPAAARAIAPQEFLIGRSVHTVEEAVGSWSGADYLVAGTVFPSASKPTGGRLLGCDGLTMIGRAVPVPVLAIGGMTIERARQAAAAGAAGIAAIGLFLGARSMRSVVTAVRTQFDRIRSDS